MDTEGRIERDVDIYISADDVGDQKKDTKDIDMMKNQTPQRTGNYLEKTINSRTAVVCLLLLNCLLSTTVIVLSINLYENITNVSQVRRQLLTNITNLTEERWQLLIQNVNLATEREQLKLHNDKLTEERISFLDFFSLTDGWTYYRDSLYFISTEIKNWTEGRQKCMNRGADLVIINSKVEQDFVKDIAAGAIVWIGLTDSEVENRWKWVDGTTMTPGNSFKHLNLTHTFCSWAPEEPNSYGGKNEDCAVTSPNGWANFPCDYKNKYLCEKIIFK